VWLLIFSSIFAVDESRGDVLVLAKAQQQQVLENRCVHAHTRLVVVVVMVVVAFLQLFLYAEREEKYIKEEPFHVVL
jgi:hypothetical protein